MATGDPLDDLAPEGYREANRSYYGAEPADYFEHRWLNLALTAGEPKGREELLEAGVSFDELRFSRDPDDNADEAKWKRGIDHFVISEVEQLSQHVGETLLRLYLTHREFPPCPPVELAKNQDPGSFKRAVRARFQDSRPTRANIRREVAGVFYGSPTRKPYARVVPAEAWTEALDALDEYLTYFARRFLQDAGLYNAAKHGLALTTGETKMELRNTPIKAAGPSIRYLRTVPGDDGVERLAITTHWVRIGREMSITWVGKEMIRSIWQAARFRYTAKNGARLQVQLFNWVPLWKIMASEPDQLIDITDMTVGLPYLVRRPEEEVS